ncbi:MAG: MFS transporter [Acidimicrobiales bacterium]|nr:MFS transporter [Acidimicrobiales bacterium]MDP6298195.1 MFS transporter [Acidimicrobiales bacterium]HJM28938.1 MFS transporter [Acidimicrobiales bacterium]HJM97788.1 MFS transporter [Acidimicrobiales bacterium]
MEDQTDQNTKFLENESNSSPITKTRKGKFLLSPFVRLSRVHALCAAGDAMITVALAGSLFFSIDPSAARWRVGLYLALTIAPFAVVSPLIGPVIDRYAGGRRLMIIAINLGRVITAILMVANLDSLFLFPLAFTILVLQKSYAIAKAAVVPTTVSTHEELVEKNARLAFLSGLAGFAGAAPSALAQLIGGPSWSVILAAITFSFAVIASLKLPKSKIATTPEQEQEREELRSVGIIRASNGMGVLRGVIGFFTFLVAFAYRGGTDDLDLSGVGTSVGTKLHEELLGTDLGASGTSAIALGAVVAFSVTGGLIGSIIAPKLRARISEERMLLGALLTTTVAAVLGLWSGGISGALLVGFAVGLSVSSGKLAFDSIVQRDAPDANYGRSFARFETRFQLMWVFGALIPVIFTLPARLGFLVLAIAAGFASISYIFGANNDESSTSQNTFGLLRNLLRNDKGNEKSVEPQVEIPSEKLETERELFIPYPQDPDDDNFKLF